MKKFFKFSLIIFILPHIICAQFIVIRKYGNGNYGPLTDQDIADERISQILMKYTWPSCIAQNLTEQEKKILLTPNKNQLVEKFLQEKLQKISSDLDVVFVPNTLYEFFLIKYSSIKLDSEYDADKIGGYLSLTKEDLEKLKIKHKFPGSLVEFLHNRINRIYNKLNKTVFLKDEYRGVVLALKGHQDFMKWLLTLPNKKDFSSVDDLFIFISNSIFDLVQDLNTKPIFLNPRARPLIYYGKHDISLILRCINLDYVAYGQNQEVLLRGTSFINKVNIFKTPIKFIGSTIQEKDKTLYSISFGNSLFAGYVNDFGACVYKYFTENYELELIDNWQKFVVGYAIIFNKNEYVDNYISNLFFISALSLETALFGEGEFFHSRSKPATLKKGNNEQFTVRGLANNREPVVDPLGVFLITRNPYKQARLFSDYLAKHMVVLQKGDIKSLTPDELKGFHELAADQNLLTHEYKLIEFLNNKVRSMRQRNLFAKKALTQQPVLQKAQSSSTSVSAQKTSMSFLDWIMQKFQ